MDISNKQAEGQGSARSEAREREKHQNRKNLRLISHVSTSLIALVFVASISQFELDGLKGILIDLQFRLKPWRNPNPDIALIAYDDAAAAHYYGSRKVPAEEFARLLEKLQEEKPKAVAIIENINNKSYSDYELELISEALSKLKNDYVGFTDDNSISSLELGPSVEGIAYLPGFVSRDTFSYGADNVTRRVMITVGGLPTIYSELARINKNAPGPLRFANAHQYRHLGPEQAYINWQGPPKTYLAHSSAAVTSGKFKPGTFTDKLVLIASALSTKDEDFISTPFSRSNRTTTLLEGAAHSLGTLLNDNALAKTPDWINFLIALFIGITTVNLVLFLNPIKGILFVIVEILGLFVASYASMILFNSWVDLAHPFVVACFGYYLVIPYRLVSEYRKRWHYQQKSELMAQLEQLKTNFLNLVSHDLKTPIARIQGNAELMLAEAEKPNLRKGLDSIVRTSEGLSEYVETLLDLTRIESTRIPIEKTSKDINATILDVVENKRELAAEKNITLETRLEPIFSFRFDPKLIRRVIANLVENAIKYSPPGSRILVSSTEENSWIRVSVQDEGYGIPPEDHEAIFTKFYRRDSEETRNEKGTGLGLYLVKYFTELHQGTIRVDSDLGKGSTFTVALPC